MTQATIFEREDHTLLFRTERGDIENLRKLSEFTELGQVDLYDSDVDRLNEYYYYLHMTLKKFTEELSPNMQKFVIEPTGSIWWADLSGTNWNIFKKGAHII